MNPISKCLPAIWFVALACQALPGTAQLPGRVTESLTDSRLLRIAGPVAPRSYETAEILLPPASPPEPRVARPSDSTHRRVAAGSLMLREQLAPSATTSIRRHTAYVLNCRLGMLHVFDVRNPAVPVLRGSVQTGYKPYHLIATDSVVYVVSKGSSAVQVFDVRNPIRPVLRGAGPVTVLPLSATTPAGP